MESSQDQIGAACSDLVVAIHPECGKGAGRQLEAEDQARRHVGREAGVDPHDLEIAEALRVEGLDLAGKHKVGLGCQRAVGG